MTKIEALRAALKHESDEKEIERLNKELADAIQEDAKQQAKSELDEQYKSQLEAAEQKAQESESKLDELKRQMKGGSNYAEADKAEVTEGEKYKGFNLKRARAAYKEIQEKNGKERRLERLKENPQAFERLTKSFIDMMVAAPTADYAQAKDLTEGTDTAGGYLVNDDDRDELLAYARDSSVALRRCRIVRMQSDITTMPREDGKVNLTYSGEATAMSEESATFDEITLTAKDLDGYADVSMHLEQDNSTPGGIVGVLLDQFTEAYGQKIDEVTFKSTTVAQDVFDAAGNSVNLPSSAFSSITLSELRSAVGSLKPNRRNGAVWFGEYSVIWDHVFGIQEDSQSVLIPDPRNPAQFRILGYPLEEVVQAPSSESTQGDPMLGFGNLMGYLIGERLNTLTLFRDPYTQRVNKRIRYSFFTRVGHKVALPNNFVKIVIP